MYYTQFCFELDHPIVSLEKLNRVKEYFAEVRLDVFGFRGVDFELDGLELTDIILPDYYTSFHDAELFARMLSDAVIDGEITLLFSDDEMRKFVVTKYGVVEYRAEWVRQN